MLTKSYFDSYLGVVVSSDCVASDLARRGQNSRNDYIANKMLFIGGRLPKGQTTSDDLYRAVSEAMLMGRDFEDEIISMAVGAFSEAQFHSRQEGTAA